MEPEQTALELLPALQRVDMPPPALERIAEAFISIGANRDFAGTADLARRLAERLRLADRMELPGEDARRGLINPLEVLGRLEGNPRAPLLRLPPGGQPAGPKATYPIIRCLLSIPSPALRGRIERLQAILDAK